MLSNGELKTTQPGKKRSQPLSPSLSVSLSLPPSLHHPPPVLKLWIHQQGRIHCLLVCVCVCVSEDVSVYVRNAVITSLISGAMIT